MTHTTPSITVPDPDFAYTAVLLDAARHLSRTYPGFGGEDSICAHFPWQWRKSRWAVAVQHYIYCSNAICSAARAHGQHVYDLGTVPRNLFPLTTCGDGGVGLVDQQQARWFLEHGFYKRLDPRCVAIMCEQLLTEIWESESQFLWPLNAHPVPDAFRMFARSVTLSTALGPLVPNALGRDPGNSDGDSQLGDIEHPDNEKYPAVLKWAYHSLRDATILPLVRGHLAEGWLRDYDLVPSWSPLHSWINELPTVLGSARRSTDERMSMVINEIERIANQPHDLNQGSVVRADTWDWDSGLPVLRRALASIADVRRSSRGEYNIERSRHDPAFVV